MMSAEQPLVLEVVEVNGQLKAMLPEARFRQHSPLKKAPHSLAPFPGELGGWNEWAAWGNNDRLPTEIRQKIEQVPMAGMTISKLIGMMYGNGLAYHRNSDLEEGTVIRRAYSPKIERWLHRSKVRTKWLIPQFADYRMYMQSFSEMILNRRRDFVDGIYHKPAEFCRLATQNQRTLEIDKIFYSTDFALGTPPTPMRRAEIPLLPWYDQEGYIARSRSYKFAYHSRYETPGIIYYARPWWIGLFRENGWIDASVAVPEIVNAMMQNQIVLKYHVLIPESYFQIRYKEWDNREIYTDARREAAIDGLIDEMTAALSGTENAYNSITTVFKTDIQGNPLGKVEIMAVDDKLKKDEWVPSSEVSDAQIVQGLGLHPSQVGLAPQGGKMGAGSGSDQRESFNTGISLNTLEQDIILEPLNDIARFNARVDPDWDITFFMDHTPHTTTNNQEDGLQRTGTNITTE